ncbi:glycosyltransferase family 2 protein [Pseudomarimonas arenosa]|uniref:Glycosyltransferase family 2 protein n=1 Tax=Pseudomarimonas arenosa TaxID=2774145 RepID=A0AAW3ZQ43_9GAMM|nr:glycosyltransferase family 2 protein [Pseudomarimonas arenosa]
MSQRGATVSAIVVTHNSGATLRRCVSGVLAQPEVAQLILVDNASSEAVDPALLADARVLQVRNAENLGFAQACNQGAAASTAKWLLFLNPDCFLRPGQLAEMLSLANSEPKLGLLGAQLINQDGTPQAASRRDTPTPRRLLFGASREPSRLAQITPGLERVDAISGALMLMPRSVFQQLGGFDQGYRLHCEDLDLCRRVQQAGHLVAIAPDIHVTHLKGTSSQQRPIWVEWQKHRGMWRYYSKFDRASVPVGLSAVILIALSFRFPLAAARAWWQARRAAKA